MQAFQIKPENTNSPSLKAASAVQAEAVGRETSILHQLLGCLQPPLQASTLQPALPQFLSPLAPTGLPGPVQR